MKTFDAALSSEMARHRTDLDSQGCSDREQLIHLSWFREGARWAENSPELINEILEEYQEWEVLVPAKIFIKWLEEEKGGFGDSQARIRREFIEFLNR